MRIMALVLLAALAACFVNQAAAAHGRVNYYRGNPDRGPYETRHEKTALSYRICAYSSWLVL
jgi:hypothetical protein